MNEPKNDEIWEAIRQEAERDAQSEPMLASFLYAVVLNHKRFEDALGFHLANKLGCPTLTAIALRDLFDQAYSEDASLGVAARADIRAVYERDPACKQYSMPLLYFKGFHAIQSYRIAHYLWEQGRGSLALFMQSRISEVFGVDIHPAARIGRGILIDHATSVVVGETAVVEDNVSLLHEVTLGGTGKESGDRHPKIRKGVLICAGAKLLGNIEVGEGAKIGAGSVVLDSVPAHSTAVGVPAKVVGKPLVEQPALEMDTRSSV
ncbi:MAG TPA: serine O-acetyltransferase [Candidatus Hydrogenedentes bacterium]|nr:serine O-acetyltransferase [Candidatus Hydrogenedentota bacterium]